MLIEKLGELIVAKANGKDSKSKELFTELRDSFGKHECEIEMFFDHALFFNRYHKMFFLDESKLGNDATQI